MRRVLAVDGGQSTIRVRHSSVPEIVDLAGISHLEGDTVGSVAEAPSGSCAVESASRTIGVGVSVTSD